MTDSRKNPPFLYKKKLATSVCSIMIGSLATAANANLIGISGNFFANGQPLDRSVGFRKGDRAQLRITGRIVQSASSESISPSDQNCQISGTVFAAISARNTITTLGAEEVVSFPMGADFTLPIVVSNGEVLVGDQFIELDILDFEQPGFYIRYFGGRGEITCEGIDETFSQSGYGDFYYAALSDEEAPAALANEFTAAQQSAAEQILNQLDTATHMAIQNAHTRNAHLFGELQRRRQLRSGFSTNGLSATYRGQSLGFSQVGGGAGDSDFASPWGAFVSGSIELGDNDDAGVGQANEYQSNLLVSGVDYRSDFWVLGGSVSFANGKADTTDVKDFATINQAGAAIFGSLFNENAHLDLVLSFNNTDYDFQRENGGLITGETSGSDLSFSVNGGYDFNVEQWIYALSASFTHTRVSVTDYTESTAGTGATFTVADIDRDAQSLQISSRVSYVVNTRKGVFLPYATISYRSELSGEDWDAGLSVGNASQVFAQEDLREDQAILGAGFSATLPRGWMAFAAFETSLNDDYWTYDRFDFGIRKEL